MRRKPPSLIFPLMLGLAVGNIWSVAMETNNNKAWMALAFILVALVYGLISIIIEAVFDYRDDKRRYNT